MEITPKPFGENLNAWFRSMGMHWRPLLVTCLAIYVPIATATTISFFVTGADDAFANLLLADPDRISTSEFWDLLRPVMVVFAILGVLQALATVLIYIASARAVALGSTGSEVSSRDLWSHILLRGPNALLTSFLLGISALAALVLPALGTWALFSVFETRFIRIFAATVVALTTLVLLVWLAVSISVYLQVISIEGSWAARSLSRSFRLVRGRWWPTLGFLVVAGLIASAVGQVAALAVTPLFLLAAAVPGFIAIGYGALMILQSPVSAALGLAYAIWYIEIRAENELLLAEQLV